MRPSDFGDRALSDREVFNLIFEPGFSTAQVVTDVSGRGVGMDVVKKNIEALRGQVEIKSECGSGSVFKMSLPLTLAIIDGMVVRVGSETYVIPTVSIIRSIRPAENELTTVLNQGGNGYAAGKPDSAFSRGAAFIKSTMPSRMPKTRWLLSWRMKTARPAFWLTN